MLSLTGPRGRLCDSWSRREVVSVGGLTLLGLGLPQFLRAKETAPAAGPHGFGRADSVIFVYLQGSPSHIDLWDPKPNAPAEIRGLKGVLAKGNWCAENYIVHSVDCEGPFPKGDQFAVIFKFDLTHQPADKRSKLDEVALYTVKNDKIVREEFFYVTE